jgi:hypothetical protein
MGIIGRRIAEINYRVFYFIYLEINNTKENGIKSPKLFILIRTKNIIVSLKSVENIGLTILTLMLKDKIGLTKRTYI